jgi:hypothetical protein
LAEKEKRSNFASIKRNISITDMKRIKQLAYSILSMLLLTPLTILGQTVEIDSIYYHIIPKARQAEVTSNPVYYTGDIVIPDSITFEDEQYAVTAIGNSAFLVCRDLKSVVLPSGLKTIGEHAFALCDSLKMLVLPEGVSRIGEYAFDSCVGLEEINIPEKVTSIETAAFFACSSLTRIDLHDNITSIGESAFQQCSSLERLSLGENLRSIGTRAFMDCIHLDSLLIPNNVTSIGNRAFYHCGSLSSLTIGLGVESIGGYAFQGCDSLATLTIPDNVTYMEAGVFCYCSGLTSVSISKGLNAIPGKTFSNCTKLNSVLIPNSIKSIEESAFKGCSSLNNIVLPASISLIGNEAFAKCTELTDIYCYANDVPQTSSSAFLDAYPEFTTLHVPAASVKDYLLSAPWNTFKAVYALDGESTSIPKCEAPTISYENGQLVFDCATEGAKFFYQITDQDVKKGNGNSLQLNATYHISVYASLEGFESSDLVTATLCWIDSTPQMEGITESVAEIKARPVLIQNQGGELTISGTGNDTEIEVFAVDGKIVGSGHSAQGKAVVSTNLRSGETAVIKIGERAIKVLLK